ncbi:sucrose-6-phosphate hydrolase [Leuconostoc gelidum subsp. gelidum]|uniref:glycoside hydrolase family 32 protein n=1 Tax=Leuconostoc gelidum TaxID=1244 RepID=UPI001CC340D3|nr:sucrose-6-phosphate hydrolase [Leuconostoc gelidum]MBZ6013633.1 sucrose-6-phosphate hydrolase [Leuconostoc gelidum subsp. gelidum]
MKNPYMNYFHIEPNKGLLNDPNGLVQFQGKYYFFYQWNRFATNHDYKEWGLFTSSDMIHWESIGSALLPDSFDDKDGVYSGSAIENDGKIFLFYTGNTKINGNRKSYQKTAISTDGKTFVKQKESIETPVVFSEHHRDPKVWKVGDVWWMIVGAQTVENEGAISLFISSDLKTWVYQGIVYTDPILDQMCECPDYFKLVDGTEILTVCPQKRSHYQESDIDISSYAGYIIGKMNYESKRFEPTESLKLLDEGFDFYAPQSFLDNKGRRIVTGWMSRMSEKQEAYLPTQSFGYVHCLTLPRVVTFEHGKLKQNPIEEIHQLRSDKQMVKHSFNLPTAQFEIEFSTSNEFQLFLRDKNVIISYNLTNKMFVVCRKDWMTEKYDNRSKKINKLRNIRIIADTSAMEIFLNDGEFVFSLRYFTTNTALGAIFVGENTLTLYNLGGSTHDK